MWQHDCPEEGEIEVGDNDPCSWCGAVEDLNTCLTALAQNARDSKESSHV